MADEEQQDNDAMKTQEDAQTEEKQPAPVQQVQKQQEANTADEDAELEELGLKEKSSDEKTEQRKEPTISVIGEVKKEAPVEVKTTTAAEDEQLNRTIFALRTTANREDQVMDFVSSNAQKRKLNVYSVIRPHGMRGYIFVEAASRQDAETAAQNIPYARGILPQPVQYKEIEHMLEQVKKEVDIRKSDIAEIISGPFKREQCKIIRIDKVKEEVVVELLGAAVPIPITLKMDAVKVIRRESAEGSSTEEIEDDEV